jgi:hypothetical protein
MAYVNPLLDRRQYKLLQPDFWLYPTKLIIASVLQPQVLPANPYLPAKK